MLIGVICEGPSDFPAIRHFFGNALKADGIEATFKSLHPQLDRTQPEGGWGNVLLYLEEYGPEERILKFFDGGLFADPLSSDIFDVLLIQLDADVVENDSFKKYVAKTYNYKIGESVDSMQRAGHVREVLTRALQLGDMSDGDRDRHVVCPAVDATESWCVAAFDRRQQRVEDLRGGDLVSAFMRALERFEGIAPQPEYANCSKDPKRRERYCAAHGRFWGRIDRSSPHFAATVYHLKNSRPVIA